MEYTSRNIAVLTGDIINSTRMPEGKLPQIRAVLKRAVASISPRTEVDFYRGDGWQFYTEEPESAFRLALLIRAQLLAACEEDTRIAIGIGSEGPVYPAQAGLEVSQPQALKTALAVGEAFTLSGRTLDSMTSHFKLTAALPERAGVLSLWVRVACHMADEIISGWTTRQAEICAKALLMKEATHQEIADELDPKVAKQTVTRSLSGAGWRALQAPLTAFETMDWSQFETRAVA